MLSRFAPATPSFVAEFAARTLQRRDGFAGANCEKHRFHRFFVSVWLVGVAGGGALPQTPAEKRRKTTVCELRVKIKGKSKS